MSIRDAVQGYLAEGLRVVPIARGAKRPTDNNWTTKLYTIDDFSDDVNIGVKLGSGLVDIDLDVPEAVIAGAALLPETRVHGREGNPASHYWFQSTVESYQYKDLDGSVLLEIRAADNLQTVVPPSVHASGDVLRWEHLGPMLSVEPADLLRAVRATALATLFGRHWPAGGRHVAAGHLAGFLLRLGFDAIWTQQIIKLAAQLGQDEEIEDRVRAARDTAKNHEQGKKTTGGPKLVESFDRGDELAKRVYLWMQREGDALLDQLNERHFVAEFGGDTIVGTERTMDYRSAIGTAAQAVNVRSFEQFRRAYYNTYVKKTRLGEWWLSHPGQRRFRSLVFAPPPLKCHPDDYNLWRGYALAPDLEPHPEQRCDQFLSHLFHVICDRNERDYSYLLDFFALTVQQPGTPIERAVILRGEPGAGKGTVVKCFRTLFHPSQYVQIDKHASITGRFNASLSGKVLVFADEAVWGGQKSEAGALRRIVTEDTLAIEHKHIDIVTEPNCVHLIMATNEDWVWPSTIKERRGFLLDVAQKVFATPAYFDSLYDQWEHGGAAAFLALCLQRPVARSRMGPLPGSAGTTDQVVRSFDGVHQWWLDILMDGSLTGLPEWPAVVPLTTLHQWYLAAMDERGVRQARITRNELFAIIRKFLQDPGLQTRRSTASVNVAAYRQPPQIVNTQARCLPLPSLEAARRQFCLYTGMSHQWPSEPATLFDSPPVEVQTDADPDDF